MLRRIDPIDALVYILAQLSGGVLGALLAKAFLLDEGRASRLRRPHDQPPARRRLQGAMVEGIGTFLLVLAVCAVALNPRARSEWAPARDRLHARASCVMVFGPLTGGAFNPARWFGPALVGNEFADAWAYIVGPIVGALLAAVFYRFVIAGGGQYAAGPERSAGPAPPAGETPPLRRTSSRRPPPRRRRHSRRAGRLRLLGAVHARVTFSRNYTLSLSRTCQCYCKYCAFATHRAHIHAPDEVERRLDEAVRRNTKELLVLTGERPEVNPEVAERLRELGARRLHLLRRLGLRAGAGARPAAAHQPRRALAARTWRACAR